MVADIVAEKQNAIVEQLADQAAQATLVAAYAARIAAQAGATPGQKKAAADAAAAAQLAGKAAAQAAEVARKPVTGAPAAVSESSAAALCAGQGCTAGTTGATSGAPGTSTTNGTCTAAASGCMAVSDASASVHSGPRQAGAPAPGVSGSGQAGSRLACPEAGCTGTVTSSASAHAASGRINATATATCAVTSGCQADVSASVGAGFVNVTAGCAGTGCQTHTAGNARAAWPGGHNTADARSDCTAGANGECASSVQVAANADYALAGAKCAGTPGSSCSHSWSVVASDHAAHASGSWARAAARDSGGGATGAGGGWVYAQADAGDGYAIAGVGCSNQARCTKSYAAHIEFDISWGQQQTYEQDGGIWNARRLGDCAGSRGSGCGLFRNGNNVQCTGDCSNFRQTVSNPRFTLLAPAGWKIQAAEAAYPIAKLDPATQRKAEQTGRDLRVYDRTKTRDVPDNQIIKAHRHTEKAKQRMEAEADQTAATAREQAVANGASPARADKAAQNYRASYFDAVAGTAVDPRGNVPAVVAKGQAGAMGELKAAVDHKLRFDALQAAGDRAAEAFEAKYTAAQSDDRDARTVVNTAAAANASMQSALELAGEAAALGRDFALRHGATAGQADNSGRLFQNDYLDVVNAAPQRGKLKMLAAQNHSAITQAAEDVWRGAGVGLNRPDVPDNHLQPILDHEAAEAAATVAAGVQRAGELAYQEALLSGMSAGAAENARSTAVEEYRTDLGLEISKIGVETFDKAVAPSYVIDRAGGTGAIEPGTTEVLAHPALADGQVDGGEGDGLTAAVDAAVAASTGPADALADLAPYIPYDPMTRQGDRRTELLSDPRVVDALVPGGTAEEALDELKSRQGYLAFARGQQESVQTRVGDFNDFVSDYDAKIAAARERGGASPDEALLLDIQYGQIVAAQAQLNSEILENRADVREKMGALIPVDIAIAEASGNAAAANDLRAAAANLDKIQAIELAVPEGAGAEDLNRASELVIDLGTLGDLAYANVRDSLLTSRPAGDMRLPSSGAPDAQLAAAAAIALPGFAERISDDRGNRVRQVFEAQNRDERARLAAHYTSAEFERLVAGDMESLVGLYFPASPDETPEQKAKRHDDFMLLVENGRIEDFDRVTRFLSAEDREILEDVNPDAGVRYYLRVGETVAGMADSTASGIEEKLGVKTKDTVFGNAIRDVGAIVGYAPVGMIRMGEWAVQSGQYYAGVQRAAFDPTGPHFDASTEARIEPRPGDTWDESFTRRDPFLGNMFVTPTANMGRRWGPAIFQGDFDKVINGDPSTGLMGYRDHPVLTFLEDITPFSVVGGAASMGLRIPAMAATSAARAAARAATVARAGALHAVELAESGVKKVRVHGREVELDSLQPSERAAVAAQDDPLVAALERLSQKRDGRPDGATDYFGLQLYRIQNLDHAADVTARRAAELGRNGSLAGLPGRPIDSLNDLISPDGSVRWSVNALKQTERRDVDLERQINDALSAFQIDPEHLLELSPSAGGAPGIGERFGARRDHPSDRYERPPPLGVGTPGSRPEAPLRAGGQGDSDERGVQRPGSPPIPDGAVSSLESDPSPPRPDGHQQVDTAPSGDREAQPLDGARTTGVEDRSVADDHPNPDETDLTTTVDTSSPQYQRTREEDFEELVEHNKALREEGAEQVRAMNGGSDPDLDKGRRPNKRALSTLRYRADNGQIIDLHGYSGGPGDWPPSDATPKAPHERWRLFETKDAAPYDADSPTLRGSNAWDRDKDSEAVLLEELARRQLEAVSGLSRREVDAAIFKAVRTVENDVKFRRKEYPDDAQGEAARARDRVEKTIEILNRNARRNAERNGTDYTPFTVNDIKGDVRLVVDLPSGRTHPLDAQVCDSCTDVLYSYRSAFPGVGGRFEVRNLAQERLDR
ncbi:hypothetical protein [Pseudonocardia hierapolitana]|uniref:hypothetical protein n=1 Tax=Pseudonocardia hierapolitana TaxID=1128676 RepID=UPI001478E850|nr:hypothetical protein [Pseudonocardia hierapolitana]